MDAGRARLDVLVNAAGVFDLAPVVETGGEVLSRNLAVNLAGVMHVTRAFLPGMLAAGSGLVTNVGSVAGWRAFPDNAAYSASKYGLRGLHDVLLEELRGTGVRACLLEPGAVDTGIWDPHDPDSAPHLARPGPDAAPRGCCAGGRVRGRPASHRRGAASQDRARVNVVLTDHLVCPRCGPPFGMVLLARDVRDRRVHEGEFGCPNCRDTVPGGRGVRGLAAAAEGGGWGSWGRRGWTLEAGHSGVGTAGERGGREVGGDQGCRSHRSTAPRCGARRDVRAGAAGGAPMVTGTRRSRWRGWCAGSRWWWWGGGDGGWWATA